MIVFGCEAALGLSVRCVLCITDFTSIFHKIGLLIEHLRMLDLFNFGRNAGVSTEQ